MERADIKNKLRVKEQEFDKKESQMILDLKNETDDKDKKLYTELQIKAIILKKLEPETLELIGLKYKLDQYDSKLRSLENMMPDIRDHVKSLYNTSTSV